METDTKTEVLEINCGEYVDSINEGTKTYYFDPGSTQARLVDRGWKLIREGKSKLGNKVQVWERIGK